MEEKIKNDFEKIIKNSKFSNKDIELKRDFLNKFIVSGFPNKKLENWKFSDLNQIINKNIGELNFYIDPSKKPMNPELEEIGIKIKRSDLNTDDEGISKLEKKYQLKQNKWNKDTRR